MQSTIRFLVLAAAAASSAAQAQDPSKLTVKIGAIRYAPDATTNGVTGIGIPPGADAKVGSATTPLFVLLYDLGNQLSAELVLGVPPKITATATGSVSFLGEVMSARNVAPTFLLTYHLLPASSRVRPYIGAGLNYTHFTEISSPYGWDVHLTDSYGFAGHVGVDVSIDKNWGLFASYGRANVKTDLLAVGATAIRSTIDFRPKTYALGLFYRF